MKVEKIFTTKNLLLSFGDPDYNGICQMPRKNNMKKTCNIPRYQDDEGYLEAICCVCGKKKQQQQNNFQKH